jgi:hypothetical protein
MIMMIISVFMIGSVSVWYRLWICSLCDSANPFERRINGYK